MTECRTDGTSAFNTRTEQRRLLLLDPARGKERLMEIQQHDGVVVEVAGFQQGFAKRCGRREMCHGREKEAPGLRCCCPPFPSLYIGPRERGGAALALPPRKGAAREESILPKAPRRCLPPLGLSPFSYILAHGPLGAGALGPCRPRRTPYSPCGPPGQVAPPGGPPGPFRWSRYNTDNPETCPDARNRTSHI